MDLQPPLNPALRRADALLAGFRCSDSYLSKLLYIFRTGAVLDPWLRLRLWDFGNAAYFAAQLLTLAIAVAAPPLYIRLRHCLFIAINVAGVLGAYGTIAFAPDTLLLAGAAGALSSSHGRVSAIYLGLKLSTVLQLPSPLQLFVGPALWLLMINVMLAIDRRMTLPDAVQPPRLTAGQAVLILFMIAVLPYLVVRAWERIWLLPQYRAYRRSFEAAAEAGCDGDGFGRSGCGGTNGRSDGCGRGPVGEPLQQDGCSALEPAEHAEAEEAGTPEDMAAAMLGRKQGQIAPQGTLTDFADGSSQAPSIGSTAGEAAAAAAGRPRVSRSEAVAVRRRTANVPLYRSARGGGRTCVVSIKSPLPEGSDFATVAEQLTAAAVAAFNGRTAVQGRPREGEEELQGNDRSLHITAAATHGGIATEESPRTVRLLSLVCVKGCVQLLMVVQTVGGGSGGRPDVGLGGGDGRIVTHARRLETGVMSQNRPGGGFDATALDAVLRSIVAEALNRRGGERAAAAGSEHGVRGGGEPGRKAVAAGSGDADEAPGPLLWPAVLRRLGTSGGDPQPQQQRVVGADGADGTVAVLLPAAALRGGGLMGTVVRCVVAGPAGRRVYLDVEVAVEPVAEYWLARIRLPAAALVTSGALSLHLLPPRAPPQHSPDNSPPPWLPAERWEAATATAAASTAPAAAPHQPDTATCAPLATLPLLVLPDAAAAEVRQVYDSALEGDAAGVLGALDAATCPGRPQQLSLGGLPSGALAAAAAAQDSSGLISLAYDIGSVLALQYSGDARQQAAQRGPAYVPGPQPPDPRVASPLLGFLEERGMAACLQECRRSLGVSAGGGAPVGAVLVGPAEPPGGAPEAETARQLRGDTPAAAAAASPSRVDAARVPPQADAPRAFSAAAAAPEVGAGGAPGGALAARPSDAGRSVAAGLQQKSASVEAGRPVGFFAWLRALLLGFSPPSLERSYQDFKAAQCGQLDRMGLLSTVFLRLSTTINTYRTRYPATFGALGSDAADGAVHTAADPPLAWGQPLPPPLLVASGELRLQLVTQGLHLLSSLVPLALALFSRAHARRRNRLLLLRAFLDYGTLAFILMPVPWADSLLPVPEVWVTASRRYGILWWYRSLWEPVTLQLSPHLAVWSVLAALTPFTLMMRHCYSSRWRPALFLAACNAVLQLTISAATDLRTRRSFMQRRPRDDGRHSGHSSRRASCCEDEGDGEEGGGTGTDRAGASSRMSTRGRTGGMAMVRQRLRLRQQQS